MKSTTGKVSEELRGISENQFWLRAGANGRLEKLFLLELRREKPVITTNKPDSSLEVLHIWGTVGERKNSVLALQKQLLEIPLTIRNPSKSSIHRREPWCFFWSWIFAWRQRPKRKVSLKECIV